MDTRVMVEDDPPTVCRDLFPMLQSCIYLDTGTAGLCFRGQEAAAAAFYEAKGKGCLGRDIWQAKADAVRQTLAVWMGVGPGEIEFFSGTTDALNIVSHSIDWQRGDEVVFAEDEFPSVRLAWLVAERAGAVLRQVAIASEAEREAALASAVTERTRILVVSHVHSMTGTVLDLDRLGRVARQHDALFVVDGIHALGAVPADLNHVDVHMAGVFKWPLAGFGLSVCVLRQRARAALRPSFRGYLNQPPEDGMQFAHVNYPGLYVLDASLKLLGDTIGWQTVQARTRELVRWLAEDLRAGGLELAAPEGARGGIASFPVPDSQAARLHLAAQGMHAAARGRYMRASPYFYNSREDVARFATAVLRDCLQPV